MAGTIAALFDDPGRAEGALQALLTAGLAGLRTSLVRGHAHASEIAPFRDAGPDSQLAAIPPEDRALFEDGVRRGGCVLVAGVTGDLGEAVRIIEAFEPVDLDPGTASGRGSAGGPAREQAREQGGVDVGAPLGAGLTAGMGQGNTNLASLPGAGTLVDDTSTLGTADLSTGDRHPGGRDGSTLPVGGRRAEERAGAPGVGALKAGARVRRYGL